MFHVKQSAMVEKALWLKTMFQNNGLELSALQIEHLVEYVRLLLEWNKRVNLISRKDEQNIWEHHILHCSSLVLLFDFYQQSTVLDIGTGGGLPGIPVKIFRPDLSVTLIDATKKKMDAVSTILSNLDLKGINVHWGRAEELSKREDLRGKFSYCIARAVAELPLLVTWAKPFFRPYGENTSSSSNRIVPTVPSLLVLKGGNIAKEVEATKRKHKGILVEEYGMNFQGGETLRAAEKKILYIHWER